MKKLLQTITLSLSMIMVTFLISPAQHWINSITIIPTYPTTIDTITFLADCSFTSGDCDPYVLSDSQMGNVIYASGFHCLGVATFICSYTDTFIIPPLKAGNYQFVFHLESGQGPGPCTPGIVAGPTDTLSFVVIEATGLSENSTNPGFSITPNPTTKSFIVKINDENQGKKNSKAFELLTLSGKLIKNYSISSDQLIIDADLPAGVYLCRLNNNPSAVEKLVIIK